MTEEPPIGIVIKSKGRKEEIIVQPNFVASIIAEPNIRALRRKMREYIDYDYQRLPNWVTEEGWGSDKIVFDTEKKNITGNYFGDTQESNQKVVWALEGWRENGWNVKVKIGKNYFSESKTPHDFLQGFTDVWGVRKR